MKLLDRIMYGARDWPALPFDEIKKRARLLVIDDQEFAYLKLFKVDGYTFDKWKDVDDLPKLENGYYDIVLLDIHGVGLAQSAEQGFGILKHLRKVSPAQIVVAYSNSDWSLKYQEFFDLADRKLAKGQDYVDFKRVVDELLRERFALSFYLKRIDGVLKGRVPDEAEARLIAERAILSRKPTKLHQYLNPAVDADLLQTAMAVAQTAIAIAELSS